LLSKFVLLILIMADVVSKWSPSAESEGKNSAAESWWSSNNAQPGRNFEFLRIFVVDITTFY
jgi:hypothetical protein